MNKKIMTVNGEISPEELGYCQCHEHLMLKKGISYMLNPDLCMEDMEKSSKELSDYACAGGVSLIDAQPGGCCRMERELSALSCQTGVNIISSTGFHKLCFYPETHWIHIISQADMYVFLLHELTAGMFFHIDWHIPHHASRHRAGIIKCAYDKEGLTPVYRRLFSAAMRAAKETDVPLMIHMEPGAPPKKLLDFFLCQGVNPRRVLLCHLDRTILPTEDYLSLLRAGIYLEFDTIGRFQYHDDESEADCICRLVQEGYEKQLLLSLDTTRARLRAYQPDGIGLTYLLNHFLPLLKSRGLSQAQIHQITVTNCKNLFVA